MTRRPRFTRSRFSARTLWSQLENATSVAKGSRAGEGDDPVRLDDVLLVARVLEDEERDELLLLHRDAAVCLR